MEKITSSHLVEILGNTTATEITLATKKVPTLNKKDNPFFVKEGRSFVPKNEIIRETKCVYSYGKSYEERVNESLVESGADASFKAKSLPYGEWVEGLEGKVYQYNGKQYVRVYEKEGGFVSQAYYIDSSIATESELETIRQFTPERKNVSNTQTEAGLAVEKQIHPLGIDISTITAVTIDGTDYELE